MLAVDRKQRRFSRQFRCVGPALIALFVLCATGYIPSVRGDDPQAVPPTKEQLSELKSILKDHKGSFDVLTDTRSEKTTYVISPKRDATDYEVLLLPDPPFPYTISLKNTKFTEKSLRAFESRPHLFAIHIDRRDVTDATIKVLADTKLLTKFDLIKDIHGSQPQSVDEFHTVDLNRTRISDGGLAYVAELRTTRQLFLAETEIGDRGMSHLASLKHLSVLDLSGTNITDKGLESLNQLRKLDSVNLSYTKVTHAGLTGLKGNHNLSRIDLSGTKVESIDELVKHNNVEYLALNRSDVNDAGLSKLAQLPELRFLDLGSTKITGQIIQQVAKLANMERLVLDNTAISDDALPALATLKKLKVIDFSRTKVTADGIKKFKEQLKGCQVIHVLEK